MKERFFHAMIRELCEEMDIKMEKLSYDWILQLSKDGKIRHITNYYFDNNSLASGMIVSDKYATYEVLKSQNIPVIQHTMIFNPITWGSYIPNEGIGNILTEEFIKYGKLVVKPNNEWEGKGIALCHSLKETEIAIQKLFAQRHDTVSICPYYNIKMEYRSFYLDGEVYLIYGKMRPEVIGDGNKSLKQLIEELQLPKKEMVQDNLKSLDKDYVPQKGEKVQISWKHNLSGGAKPCVLPKGDLYQEIEKLAIEVGKAMNMNFATIDIIQTTDKNLYVMEVNAGICADIFTKIERDGYEKVKAIYRKALENMFE